MNDETLSQAVEELLVERNLRNMQTARAALQPGYVLRAATLLKDAKGKIIIGTGFPVEDTFETDGPVGAMALYQALERLGAEPVIACAPPLAIELRQHLQVLILEANDLMQAEAEATAQLQQLAPAAIVAIERPGLAENGRYHNMRGEDITARCGFFDPYVNQASCPTIGIGDGGNEIGMGNIASAIAELDIKASVTSCDELVVADVSNWGAYGLIALLAKWSEQDLLAQIDPLAILQLLSACGSVDGVTRQNTLTEDGLDAGEGVQVIEQLRQLTGFRERPH
ncbi:MAG: glutamate cyclase domain-containing protein [Pseudomonadota bacterium]